MPFKPARVHHNHEICRGIQRAIALPYDGSLLLDPTDIYEIMRTLESCPGNCPNGTRYSCVETGPEVWYANGSACPSCEKSPPTTSTEPAKLQRLRETWLDFSRWSRDMIEESYYHLSKENRRLKWYACLSVFQNWQYQGLPDLQWHTVYDPTDRQGFLRDLTPTEKREEHPIRCCN